MYYISVHLDEEIVSRLADLELSLAGVAVFSGKFHVTEGTRIGVVGYTVLLFANRQAYKRDHISTMASFYNVPPPLFLPPSPLPLLKFHSSPGPAMSVASSSSPRAAVAVVLDRKS